jgi:uncharacterized membrane protein
MNIPDRRIESIDLARGLIIVIMALDHVRDFFGDAAASPTDLDTTTAALFFTRWITHFQSGHSIVLVSYVLIPWIGVTALGYVLGAAYRSDASFRQRLLLRLGAILAAAFVVLRLVNAYGDPAPWPLQHSLPWTVISFLNTTKYPPSLLFLLMTLGPALLLLRAFDTSVPTLLRPALIIGKVPLFFFVVHFFVIHLLVVAASYVRFWLR